MLAFDEGLKRVVGECDGGNNSRSEAEENCVGSDGWMNLQGLRGMN